MEDPEPEFVANADLPGPERTVVLTEGEWTTVVNVLAWAMGSPDVTKLHRKVVHQLDNPLVEGHAGADCERIAELEAAADHYQRQRDGQMVRADAYRDALQIVVAGR